MNLLALETSTEYLSLAVQSGMHVFTLDEQTGPAASQRILPEIDRLLSDAGLTLSALDGLVYGTGPGAFTGVRVAVGVAQGLAFGANLPVVGISSLIAVAEAAWQHSGIDKVLVCLDARMGEVYHAAYLRQSNHSTQSGWQAVTTPCVCKPEQVPAVEGTGWLGAGSGWGVFAEPLNTAYASQLAGVAAHIQPQASTMLTLAAPLFVAGQTQAAHEAAPLYIRNRVALTAAERAAGQTL